MKQSWLSICGHVDWAFELGIEIRGCDSHVASVLLRIVPTCRYMYARRKTSLGLADDLYRNNRSTMLTNILFKNPAIPYSSIVKDLLCPNCKMTLNSFRIGMLPYTAYKT